MLDFICSSVDNGLQDLVLKVFDWDRASKNGIEYFLPLHQKNFWSGTSTHAALFHCVCFSQKEFLMHCWLVSFRD